jgi:hypothetical protein
MTPKIGMIAGLILAFGAGASGAEPAVANKPAPQEAAVTSLKPDEPVAATLADKRYEEMLDRMQTAVEEVAELYGNPEFLQVFTNDAGRADDLRRKLAAARGAEDANLELASLKKRRDELAADIALKEREAAKLSAKLQRQRLALDALAAAVEQARRAVEDTTK